MPSALCPVSHETISTLYGGQFNELFAYTLRNRLWKLHPKQPLFGVFSFRNYLFDLTIVGLITVIQVLICVFHAVSVEKSGYKTPVFLYLFSIIILNLSELNRLLCEYANLEFMIYISMIVIISIPYCHVVYQQKWQTFLNGSENQPQLTALLKSLMLNRNRENHNAPIPALDFTKQKRPFSKH